MDVLETFSGGRPRQTLSEIARKAQLPVPTVHRLLQEMESAGAIKKVDRSYEIGAQLWLIGVQNVAIGIVQQASLSLLTELARITGGYAHLTGLIDDRAICLASVAPGPGCRASVAMEGKPSMGSLPLVGSSPSLVATASGKVLLNSILRNQSGHPCARALRCLYLAAPEVRSMRVELAASAARRWATYHDVVSNTFSIAVPVTPPHLCSDIPPLALGLSFDSRRQLSTYSAHLHQVAERLSHRLRQLVADVLS
ncbi:helix-turn-helix domain-containing protein [Pseudonocardia sp. N23]|uniref:helix-turn-helix domain-containing protein n=1 Tax=Pseudonocardia sp. N23 TaxID=1987376 RepID=UPI0035B60223